MPRGQKNKKVLKRQVKKAHLKKKRDAKKDADQPVAPMAVEAPRETARQLKKRQAGERRKLKRQVADLKRQRKSLSKKSHKNAKKELSVQIYDLTQNLAERQKAELTAAGVARESRPPSEAEEDDDEDEEL
mmetsp:Transcript_88406/g.205685  ORF Transcript_88406/g.205685 Transcript_88406/m.205685 type:complete len:131 (-) Transcript_88406:172-564(-)